MTFLADPPPGVVERDPPVVSKQWYASDLAVQQALLVAKEKEIKLKDEALAKAEADNGFLKKHTDAYYTFVGFTIQLIMTWHGVFASKAVLALFHLFVPHLT